jgi:hypothetical protein
MKHIGEISVPEGQPQEMVNVEILLFGVIESSLLSLQDDTLALLLLPIFLVRQGEVVPVESSRNDEEHSYKESIESIPRVKLDVDLVILEIRPRARVDIVSLPIQVLLLLLEETTISCQDYILHQ